ncbi:DUF2599 domain-containing protein [Pseudomonas rubra]|uniref:DUF2599 domain-containing protein n=1 Tax=Pseudomonas rubra TaxID=2942627 RepID=A0ABT5P4V7_9PSED|nr:DUF2599 domain-containing protein [Pseudomonas rubra]MDD1013319.1 DUF2599 domain-containing protein [Pseudomonas rubra]MDD1037468.1 DUF2599 domain-containing protein [Pseudomonas rubra]MDD1155644.1 DUF2599 domain-containing protein [Pseudomonas rubra]
MNSKLLAVGTLIVFPVIHAHATLLAPVLPPNETTQRINNNYNKTDTHCTEVGSSAARGHYYCSGVSLRMVNDGDFYPWDYSPYAIKTGATSWSWIRRDLSINTLIRPAGMIMRNPADAEKLKLPIKESGFVCIYSFDAGTGPDRKWYGCGQTNENIPANAGKGPRINKNSEIAYGSCPDQNVNNDADWLSRYTPGILNPLNRIQKPQCSWDAESPSQWDSMIKVHESRATTSALDPYAVKTFTNEFMLKNASDTNDGSENMKYIDAFVYNPATTYNYPSLGDTAPQKPEDGLTVARNFQKKLYDKGYLVPILRVNFDKPAEERFSYVAADQQISLENRDEESNGENNEEQNNNQGGNTSEQVAGIYIMKSEWVSRYDSDTKKNEWSLRVTPTAFGREIRERAQTNAMYEELLARHGNDTQWRENEKTPGSMRRQLVCLLTEYRSKDNWYLEPFRPYVEHDVAVAAHCNPLSADSSTDTDTPSSQQPGVYIASTQWINRYDPGTGQNEWTLQVTPTAFGREIRKRAQTDAMYDELVSRNGKDSQWTENEKSEGSMRRQLVCLLTEYRPKAHWNLEPFRPNVSHEAAVSAGCNPL